MPRRVQNSCQLPLYVRTKSKNTCQYPTSDVFSFYQVVGPLGRKSVNKYLYLYLYLYSATDNGQTTTNKIYVGQVLRWPVSVIHFFLVSFFQLFISFLRLSILFGITMQRSLHIKFMLFSVTHYY